MAAGLLRYSTNYLIDVENAIIVDVEATTAIRQAEVLAAKRMIERSMERFDLYPARLLVTAPMALPTCSAGWSTNTASSARNRVRQIGPQRRHLSRDDFTYDHERDVCFCPGGKKLTTTGTLVNDDATILYRASNPTAQDALSSPSAAPTRRLESPPLYP